MTLRKTTPPSLKLSAQKLKSGLHGVPNDNDVHAALRAMLGRI